MSAVEARRSHGVRTLAIDDPSRVTADLYRAYGHSVYRFAFHMLGNREDAEDAAQAAFLSIHAALAAGTEVREPQAWVLKVARNECLGRISGRMRRPLAGSLDDEGSPEVPAHGPSVPHAVELRGDVEVASLALEGLPTTQREAFVLREWLGLTTGEIADSLGTTVSAVDALLNRARRELIRAVAAGEGSAGCGQTRQALQRGLLDRRTRAHLVRCKPCRAARRAVQPTRAGIRGLVPPAAIGERLADALPGFSLAGSAVAVTGAASSGGIAALAAKSVLTPVAMKTAAAAALAALAVGGATELRGLSRPSPARRVAAPLVAPPTSVARRAQRPRAAREPTLRRATLLVAAGGGTGGGTSGSGGVRAPVGTSGALPRGDGGSTARRFGERTHRSRDGGGERTRRDGGGTRFASAPDRRDGELRSGTHHHRGHHAFWRPSSQPPDGSGGTDAARVGSTGDGTSATDGGTGPTDGSAGATDGGAVPASSDG